MRKGLHPWLRTVTVWLKDGSAFRTKALYTGKGPVKDQIVLTQEPSTHAAWTGQRKLVGSEEGAFKQFEKKFGFKGEQASSLLEKLGARKTRRQQKQLRGREEEEGERDREREGENDGDE